MRNDRTEAVRLPNNWLSAGVNDKDMRVATLLQTSIANGHADGGGTHVSITKADRKLCVAEQFQTETVSGTDMEI